VEGDPLEAETACERARRVTEVARRSHQLTL
jgi:hypothetical protein